MNEEVFDRQPTTQDVSWLLDLDRNGRLDLDPPYQRRSVWTRKDRQFFLDTIFRRYPSPAIFLHKTLDGEGIPTYHVVDGKQRIETILGFVDNKIRMAKTFGDSRLNGKRWSDLQGEPSLLSTFWNYQITVEMITVGEDTAVINAVFDRLNRNSRKLTRQELRHARFDGWFISLVEKEVLKPEWKDFGIATPAREKRMADSQIVSELLLVVLEAKVLGFDQDGLDELYAKYDDCSPETDEPEELGGYGSVEEFAGEVERIKTFLLEMETATSAVSGHARTNVNFYALWSVVALGLDTSSPSQVGAAYSEFMQSVEAQKLMETEPKEIGDDDSDKLRRKSAAMYYRNMIGASTEGPQRIARCEQLLFALSS